MLNFIYKLKSKINFYIWLNIKKTHRSFLKEKKISLIREIKCDFYNESIDLKINNYSDYVFFEDKELNNKIIKQYIGKSLSNNKFFYLFYFFYRKNISGFYCLPSQYLKYFQKHYNIKINFFLSKIFFFTYVFQEFLKGTNFMVMIFIKIFKSRGSKKKFSSKPYDVIFNFSCKNFNIKKNQFSLEQYNIINWLIKNNSSKKIILQGDNEFSYENGEIKISSEKNIVDNIVIGLKDYKIFFSFLIFFCSTLKNLILFNWWNVVLFKDALEAFCFKLSDAKFANNYYTIFTSNIYKPLWTYEVEKKKSKVELLTISSLTDLEHVEKGSKFDYEGICLFTWNNIIVWNEQSKQYIKSRNTIKKDNIKVINSHIYYKDINQDLNLPNFSVAAFTYENHRFNLTNSFLTDWVLSYTTDLFYLNKIFWNDLLLMKEKYDFTLIVKKKRDFPDKFDYKRGLKFNKWLKNQHKVIEVDNNYAIEKIINNSKISISMPFTSPSIVANYLNKKSIYYDPTGLININDPNSSSVEIVSGQDKLDKYFRDYLKIGR